MIIKSMTATFGKLEKAKLTCAEGLNLIHAPNEGGKSTWAAFYQAMLYGIDTRDRDKKGYLAPKNHYQPWSGAPMEGEMVVEWEGREIAIRRSQKGATPFGTFSAVYTDTGEKVPGMTGSNCGVMLTGVSKEVFERSAFIGADLSVTAAPELEKRLTALLTSGQEDVSFSQTQATLKEWLNRRKVNRTVGLIPKLEGELEQARADLARTEECRGAIARLEAARAQLREEQRELEGELDIHRRLAQKQLNARFAQAEEDYQSALRRQETLEREFARFDPLPDREQVKKMQFELQYLKVLDEEIKSAQTALEQAEMDYEQAQAATQNDHFPGLSAEEARQKVTDDRLLHQTLLTKGQRNRRWSVALLILAMVSVGCGLGIDFYLSGQVYLATVAGGCAAVMFLLIALLLRSKGKKCAAQAAAIPGKYGAESMEHLITLLADYEGTCAHARACAETLKAVHTALNDRIARRENSHHDIFAFVHTFAPEVKELFGCSAALSRALSVEHELAAARDRAQQCRLRRDDLEQQGGQPFQTLELLHTPERTEEQTRAALSDAAHRLSRVEQELSHTLGRQQAMGDPAALYARREQLENELNRRNREHEALSIAMTALAAANEGLQQRFSPQLNAAAGEYFARLTGQRYARISLNRDLEGETARAGDILPHSALYLSRGTADQLYLAVRLAVCKLCLPELPPIMLDDALTAFDDERAKLALQLLRELSEQQQILLFTCHKREGEILEELT